MIHDKLSRELDPDGWLRETLGLPSADPLTLFGAGDTIMYLSSGQLVTARVETVVSVSGGIAYALSNRCTFGEGDLVARSAVLCLNAVTEGSDPLEGGQ